MPAYHFKIHNNGTKSETLGAMALAGDAEAIAFGVQTIRDFMDGNAKHYTGWSMDITEGKRSVGNLPFKFYAKQDHEK